MAKDQLVNLDFKGTQRIENLPDPAAAQQPATKAYVDAAIEGQAWKDDVRAGSNANINLAAPGANIGGVAMAANDRFLAKDQADNTQNGIYVYNGAAAPATRSLDANTAAELKQATVNVLEGVNANTTWRQTALVANLGADPVTFGSFSQAAPAASEVTAGIAEIATQAETDAGASDTVTITPQKLNNWSGRKRKATGSLGNGAATAFNIDHNFNMRELVVEVYRNSGNYDSVIVDVTRPTANRVTITFGVAPGVDAFAYSIIG